VFSETLLCCYYANGPQHMTLCQKGSCTPIPGYTVQRSIPVANCAECRT